MQPGMAVRLDPEGEQPFMAMIAPATGETTLRRRAHGITVKPSGNAARESPGLGLGARQAALELGDRGTLTEEEEPVLGRPAVATRPHQGNDTRFIPRQQVEEGGRRRRTRLQQEVERVARVRMR